MGKKIVLSTGHKHAFHRISALLALEKGYFREEGLEEVDLIASGEDTKTVEMMRDGRVDYGLDVKPGLIIEGANRGEELYIIGGMLNKFPSTLISTPEIKTIADLKGKRIGVKEEGGSRERLWIMMLLRQAGLDPMRDVTWVTHAGYGSLEIQKERLKRGDYHAVGLSGHYKRPELYDEVRKAGFNVLADRLNTHPEGLPDRVIAAPGSKLTSEPDTTIKVLKGIIRGYRFARDAKNRDVIREMYLRYNWGKEGFGWGKFDEGLLEGMIDSARYLPADGSVNEKGLSDIIAELKAQRVVGNDFSISQILRLSFVKQAARELDDRFGPGGY